MNWADEMIPSYKAGREDLKAMKGELGDSPIDQQDKTQLNSMIEEMSFLIGWMETGRQPGAYRGIDHKNVYKRKFYSDMDVIPDITEQLEKEQERKRLYMSQDQRKTLLTLFQSFSERERQCYIMHTAEGLSMNKIANMLGIRKRTVQQYIERAREKVEKQVS